MLHILHILLAAYSHHHPHLFRFYIRHGALRLLRSGYTSGSGGIEYLRWLTAHHISPVDW